MPSDAGTGIEVEQAGGTTQVRLEGDITIRTLSALDGRLRAVPAGDVAVDLSHVTRLDTAGAWALDSMRRRLASTGANVVFRHASPEMTAIMKTVSDALERGGGAVADDAARPLGLEDRLERLGRGVVSIVETLLGFVAYLGIFLSSLARGIARPRTFRLTSLVHHCEDVGLNAVPIVALMAFLIGVVLAFQGAVQLRQFGAEVFVVDLIAVSILRELGVLLTSIIVAGRTASAFTAAIGSMKMREEIDAMRTLGLDPVSVLFVPRILALILMLPLLALIANFVGIFGGALMAWIELGISPASFQTRLLEGMYGDQLLIGLVKAPVFALIIGIVGCRGGMQVESNAESLGRQTSKSVVAAIFAVILADALFSIFFAELGI